MTFDEDRLAAIDAPVRVFGEVPNTTDWVRRRGFSGAPHGTFAVAEALTAAVGRTGNDWSAPPGGVWSSVLLRPELDAETAGRLTLASGLAVLDTVRAFGVDAALKWPNDVVVPSGATANQTQSDAVVVPSGAAIGGGESAVGDDPRPAKLAGVLVERVADDVPVAGKAVSDVLDGPATLQFVVVGVGINADLDPSALATDRPVTTMRAAVGPVDRTAVARELHANLLARAGEAETEAGYAALREEWTEAAATLGERVVVHRDGADPVVGVARELDETGGLVVETDDGGVVVTEGECERLRRG
ncbi:biotin--[acetyl-CoA-carboxylase] ligase [Halomarina litorea]|uniref:biotin--[acetyl-CoA-carboxylase] ligase n=1 Tax=Halomarina litorea TaxID=2961595 RepID=UPI0020C3927F|nr:biotin--[acetyl-CoA-carboxylase] ligase [Halomarina sp. BCD28]